MTREEAKEKLDNVIEKSRTHLYKPIQIAEILYYQRTKNKKLNLLDLESYRTISRKWRDSISLELLGTKCTSSSRFQDNLFEKNALPPEALKVLGKENLRTNGAVEAYIYRKFENKHDQLETALLYCMSTAPEDFYVSDLINSFWNEPGLRRSIDKIYEIIVYSLFESIVSTLDLKVDVSVAESKIDVLNEFEDFASKVMCLDAKNLIYRQDAHVYRVGIANASDRGLDLYSNWGPAIQIKHLALSEELAENIVDSISSDRIVIVCKEAESRLIFSLLSQIGWRSKIQSIVTEKELIEWYEKALRGKYKNVMGQKLLSTLVDQIGIEFPSIEQSTQTTISKRNYSMISDEFWLGKSE